MNENELNKSIAVFIDNENIREDENDFNGIEVCQFLSANHGKIVLGKSYWAFGRKGSGRNFAGQLAFELFQNGIEIVPVPTFSDGTDYPKNIADGKMMIDIMFYLERYNNIDIWAIVSNDKDFIPILEELKRRGKYVILIHSQENVHQLIRFCERLGIIRIEYKYIKSHEVLISSENF